MRQSAGWPAVPAREDRMARRPRPLRPAQLYRPCDPAALGFGTTADLATTSGVACQERALEAVEFAVGMRGDGYNVFVLGPEGTGKQTLLRQILQDAAARDPVPPDACYVHNFADPQRPRALILPAGTGRRLRDDLARLVDELRGAIRAAFESEQYRATREAMDEELRKRRDALLDAFGERASARGFAFLRSPLGVGLAPQRDGHPIEAKDFEALSPDERRQIEETSGELQAELAQLLRQLPILERAHRTRIRELDRLTTRRSVGHLIDELHERYATLPEVQAHLEAIRDDVVENAQQVIEGDGGPAGTLPGVGSLPGSPPWTRRYLANLIIDNGDARGAPVVTEDYPTLQRLVGRVENLAMLGALVTDFTLIRPGALHRANGGYLVLDVRKVLLQPQAWEGLKRALRTRELRPESLAEALGLASTVSLEPMPIPLHLKVALVGDRQLYYLLAAADPDFPDLFKVQADMDDDVPRSDENSRRYAEIAAGTVAREHLRPFDAAAIARVLEEMARRADESDRLSADMRFHADLLREADAAATARLHQADAGADAEASAAVTRVDVLAALASRERRAGRVQERVLDAIGRGTLRVATTGSVVGQVNALTVAELGDTRVAWPTRVTCRTRLGRGELVDIEREVELGGPIHSKGVLILAGFLGERYARGYPLSLHASITFEQSYGSVEGDSASLAELCALLSAIGDLPLRQGLAVTGSVDQRGQVQAIGAVNTKVEGFFDACRRRGFSGGEGVVIPAANVAHLMLREEIVAAARAGTFAIYAVDSVDEAMALLAGIPAGAPRTAEGAYPSRTVNGSVQRRLQGLANQAREFAAQPAHAAAQR
jgi:predicted ATP-dependent protease